MNQGPQAAPSCPNVTVSSLDIGTDDEGIVTTQFEFRGIEDRSLDVRFSRNVALSQVEVSQV